MFSSNPDPDAPPPDSHPTKPSPANHS
jgi:hypothetical protein